MNTRQTTFIDILTEAQEWDRQHSPFDKTTRLPLMQYMLEDEGTHGALVPFAQPQHSLSLLSHAQSQLLMRLEYPERLFNILPPKLNLLNVNWLIQNKHDRDLLFRVQDTNRVRAIMTPSFEPFDNLELLSILEPYCEDAEVHWYHNDEKTLHISITWKWTQTEVKVGDVVKTGIHISNSEVGLRSVTIAGFLYRLKCTNGMIGYGEGGGIRRFRHIGDSARIRDHVETAIEELHVQNAHLIEDFKASMEKVIYEPFDYMQRVQKDKDNNISQEQFKSIMDSFINEPERNLFGVVNAITAAAQRYEGEERFELERLGVKVLESGLR